MKVLVAVDRFCDKLSADAAGKFIAEGIKQYDAAYETILLPLFEGNRDLVDGVLAWQRGTRYDWMVDDAQMNSKSVAVAGIDDTLYIDSASIYSARHQLDHSTSKGLGDLLMSGLDLGYRHFVIALGESFVFDGGMGMLQQLGVKFYDMNGEEIVQRSADMMKYIRTMNFNFIDSRLEEARFTVINNDDYALYGSRSQAAQLNLPLETVQKIDNNIWYFNEQLKKVGLNLMNIKNGGNGGGLAAMFGELFEADLLTSKALIERETQLESLLSEADIIIFGGATTEISDGTLVAKTIMDKVDDGKQYFYLTGGHQLPVTDKRIYQLNVYPEITAETTGEQIGIQLQQAINTLLHIK